MAKGPGPYSGASPGLKPAPKRKARRKKEVAGPYRSQSSNPKIRSEATAEEHRKVSAGPTRSQPRKARRIKRELKRVREDIRETLRDADLPGVEDTPQFEVLQARTKGRYPSEDLKRKHPRAYEKAEKAAEDYHDRFEGLKEDPLAELAISTVATAGLGAAAKGAGALAKSTLASRAGSQLSSVGTTAAEQVAEKGVKAVAARTASKAGKSVKARAASKAERIRSTPTRVKTAPKRAKKALSTKQGRRRAVRKAGRKAVRHPIRTGVPAAMAVPPGVLPENADIGERARAFAEGTANAISNDPGKTLETTGKGVLGFLTAPVAVAGAGVESVRQGSTDPLASEGKALYEGTKKMVEGLASGDPKRVEETTLNETGLTPFLPVPHVVRRAKRSKAYTGARGKVRGKVEGRRARTRERRIEAEKARVESGEFVPKRKGKKIRQPVADTARPGENYIFRRAGKFQEKQRSRHYVSREATRIQEEGSYAGKRSSEAVAKRLRKSKGTNRSEQNYGEALRIVVKHGIPADEVRGPAFVKRIQDNYEDIAHGDVPSGVHLDRHSTQYILDHPEIFRDPDFWKAVEEFDAASEPLGTSPRNRYLAQVDNVLNPMRKEEGKLPILKPEEMIPDETAAILQRAVPRRSDRWSRDEALDYAKDLAEIQGPSRKRALAIRGELLDSLDGLMRSPKHGGAEGGVSTTQAKPWTPDMVQRFVKEAAADGTARGLRRPAAYVADVIPSSVKGADKAPVFGDRLALKKSWPSQGKAARSGNAQSDLESVLYSSLEAPYQRKAMVRGLTRIFDKASRQVAGKRFLTHSQLEKAINTNRVPEGTIFVRPQAIRALLEGDDHVTPEDFHKALETEVEHGQKLASSSGAELRAEVEAMKGAKGEKYAPVDAAAVHELMGQMQPLGAASRWAAKSTNFATRVILNSPAFALIQIPQEGLPLAAALGRNVVNIPRALANLKAISKLDVESQAQIRAVAGSSVGVLGAPSTKALRAQGFMDPVRIAGGTPAWRHAWNVANGNVIGRFDRARAGRFREVAAMAKLEGDFRRAQKGFTLYRSSANNLFKNEAKAVEAMKGMTPAERMAYMADHPRLADQMMQDMAGMAGNWNSFTAFEKQIAPFAVFYPFQRYSALWMLYHFPLDHPIVATSLTLLGQVNARELEAIAAEKGATPAPLDYVMPVIGEGEDATVLPAGARTFPGLGAVQQAAATNKPSQLIGALSPALGIPLEAATGKSGYTGQDIDENGWEFIARQVASLSPLSRFLGVADLGQEKSPAGQAFEAQDPLRKWRSTLAPTIGQTAEQYAETKKLEKGFDTKYGKGDIPGPFDSKLVQELLYGRNGGPKPEMLPEVLREIHAAERASNYIERQEKPFLPPSKDFSPVQKELLQAIEDAWQTGPNAEPEETTKYGGSGKYSSGNKYLGGNKYAQGNPYLK